jgi:hypothetical protein
LFAWGYRGKVAEQERARELRALGWTYQEICTELAVSRASVSLWVRDVEVPPDVWAARVRANRSLAGRLRRGDQPGRREVAIERYGAKGAELVGAMSERDLFIAGIALYAGEGSKTDGSVKVTNSDPRMIDLFLRWFRRFFEVDESRLRMYLYLHLGLDLEAAVAYWSELTQIPVTQFRKPYRAVPNPSIRRAKHPLGCPTVVYSHSTTHRVVMGMVRHVLTAETDNPG